MSNCNDRRFENMLHAYELGMLSESEREEIEIHLLDCDHCYARLMEMKREMALLRNDPDVRLTINDSVGKESSERPLQAETIGRRPFWQRIMPTLVTAAALLVFLIIKPWRLEFHSTEEAIAAENRMAIMYFENLAQRDDPARLGEIAANLLITDLSESNYLTVISGQRLYDILKAMGKEGEKVIDRDIAGEVARQADARWMILGYILQVEPKLVMTTQLVDVATDQVVSSQQIAGEDGEDVFALVDRLTVEIKTDLTLPVDAFREADRFIADVTTHSPEAYRYYLTGLDYLAQNYWAEAKVNFRKAIEEDSTFAMAYYYLTVHEDYSLIAKTVQYMDKTTRREQYYIKILQEELKGNHGQVLVYLHELLRLYPDEKEALFLLADAELVMQNYDMAIRLYRHILELDPLHKMTHNQLAFAYAYKGEFEKALQANDTYISLAPNEANPYDSRGLLLAGEGRLDDAILFFKKALDIKPDFNTSWLELGNIYVFKREFDRARDCYRHLMADPHPYPRTVGRTRMAQIPLYQGKYREALTLLNEAIVTDSIENLPPTWINTTAIKYRLLSAINIEIGDYDAALKNIRKYTDIATTHFPMYRNGYLFENAVTLAQCGQLDEADAVVDTLKNYLYQSGQPQSFYQAATGIVALLKGNVNQAVSSFEKIKPGLSSFQMEYWHASAYIKAGQAKRALNILDKYRDNYSSFRSQNMLIASKYLYLYGVAYQQAGMRDQAIAAFADFLDLWQNADRDLFILKDAQSRLRELQGNH
ncbi:MAG: tetratricopeptide repeat protein [candidate division Zixibacteria bacterium]|nr:tetratricopeptide repeat protein [candidate division Zixibacteria bacterium]